MSVVFEDDYLQITEPEFVLEFKLWWSAGPFVRVWIVGLIGQDKTKLYRRKVSQETVDLFYRSVVEVGTSKRGWERQSYLDAGLASGVIS